MTILLVFLSAIPARISLVRSKLLSFGIKG